MIRIAGDQSLSKQAIQLASLEESYQLKKISASEYETKKVNRLFYINFKFVDLASQLVKFIFIAWGAIAASGIRLHFIAGRQRVSRK